MANAVKDTLIASTHDPGGAVKPYLREDEAVMTCDVGGWYYSACYWRQRAEAADHRAVGAERALEVIQDRVRVALFDVRKGKDNV